METVTSVLQFIAILHLSEKTFSFSLHDLNHTAKVEKCANVGFDVNQSPML